MKVGIDIAEIERFKLINVKQFIVKYLTMNEIEYVMRKSNIYETIAGIYACKEAVLKAFKIGIGNGVSLKDIEILHDENNVPKLNMNAVVKKLLEQNNCKEADISISHSEVNAIAICVIM